MNEKLALNSEIQDYIKEFLKYNNFSNTMEVLDAEFKTIQVLIVASIFKCFRFQTK